MKLKKKKPGATLSETVREDVEWEDSLTYNNVEKNFKHFKVLQSVKKPASASEKSPSGQTIHSLALPSEKHELNTWNLDSPTPGARRRDGKQATCETELGSYLITHKI